VDLRGLSRQLGDRFGDSQELASRAEPVDDFAEFLESVRVPPETTARALRGYIRL
jgi:hypothetical protein